MPEPGLLEVGKIDRPHGLKGDVVVTLLTDRTERVAPGSVLQTEQGPLTVRSAKPLQHRWIVAFEGVTTREAAALLHGRVLHGEPLEDADALWVHDLIGAEVVTPDGRSYGTVESVQENPASDLLVLGSGTLVPIVFIVDESGLPARLVVDPPPGLLDEVG